MTFLSRILGLVRDFIIARYFGANDLSDAFLVAFRIPNFFRRLFAEGAFSQAFIPILADAKAKQQRTAYNQLDRPRLVNQQQRDYSQFFVSRMLTGAEFSGTAFDAALDFQVNQALDLSIADYNESIEYDEVRNQSLLLEARGRGERYRGQLTAGVQLARAGGSLLEMVRTS